VDASQGAALRGGSAPRPEDTQIGVRRTYERRFAAGEVVFEEGEPGEVLYIVVSGEVELTRRGPAGPRLVARIAPGEFFGEMSVVLGGPRTVGARVTADAVLLELDAATLESMCVERPEIAIRIIRRLAVRVIELEGRLDVLGVDELLRPVVRALLRDAEPGPDGLRVASSLEALAEAAGLSLLDAHRALRQLFERKVVRLVDDVLLANDLEALSAVLDGSL